MIKFNRILILSLLACICSIVYLRHNLTAPSVPSPDTKSKTTLLAREEKRNATGQSDELNKSFVDEFIARGANDKEISLNPTPQRTPQWVIDAHKKQLKNLIELQYSEFFKEENIDANHHDNLLNLLAEKNAIEADAVVAASKNGITSSNNPKLFASALRESLTEIESKINSALGDSLYAHYQSYCNEIPARNTLSEVANTLTSSNAHLQETQKKELLQILRTQLSSSNDPEGKFSAVSLLGNKVLISERSIEQMKSVLNEQQYQSFEIFLRIYQPKS